MIHPSQVSIVVIMCGSTPYWEFSRPFIEQYCRRCGYEFVVVTENKTPEEWHPSWNKLVAPPAAGRPHVLLWDADLIPMPLCPPIHFFLDPERLGMVKIEPSRGGRMKLRRRYGHAAEPHLHFNCGLISVPLAWRNFLAGLHTPKQFETSVFWEQGAVNEAVYHRQIDVDSLDPRWNVWVTSSVDYPLIDSSFCLHFAKGSARRMRNIGMLCRLLRLRGIKLPF